MTKQALSSAFRLSSRAQFRAAAVAALALVRSASAAGAADAVAATAGASAGLTEEEAAISREWSGKVGFGFDAQGGNTTQHGLNASAEAKKLEGEWVVLATAGGGWEEKRVEDSDGAERDERTEGFAEAEINVKRRFEGFFLYGDLSGRNDDIAGVKYRFAESVGLGTFLLDEEGLKLSVEAGVAEVQEKLEGSSSDEYTAIRLAERGDWLPSWGENVSFFESAEWIGDVDDSDHWFAKAEVGVDIPMAASLALTLKGSLDHENQPAAGKDKTDRRVTAQIGWTF